MAFDGIYISGYFIDEDNSVLDNYAKELHAKGVPLYVRNISGSIMAAMDFADIEVIQIAYTVLQHFMLNGGYDLAKAFVVKLWEFITKGRSGKHPFTITIEGIPTKNGPETIKCKISGPMTKAMMNTAVTQTFSLASQIENHQYQLLARSRYYPAINGHLFRYNAESEEFSEVDLVEEIKRLQDRDESNS